MHTRKSLAVFGACDAPFVCVALPQPACVSTAGEHVTTAHDRRMSRQCSSQPGWRYATRSRGAVSSIVVGLGAGKQ
jgi:hypothetical protein